MFDVYTSIAQAIEATRSGHEDGYAAYLKEALDGSGPVINVGVYSPAPGSNSPLCRVPITMQSHMTVVSMSWWMSQPVQAYLDAQLCAPENQKLACALRLKGISVLLTTHPFKFRSEYLPTVCGGTMLAAILKLVPSWQRPRCINPGRYHERGFSWWRRR
jgi:hypothetical protein